MVEEGKEVTSPAKSGFLPGDEILAVDGSQVDDFMDIQNRIITGKQQTAQGTQVSKFNNLNDGQEKKLEIYPEVWGPENSGHWHWTKETFLLVNYHPICLHSRLVCKLVISLFLNGQIIHSFSQLVYMPGKVKDESVSLTARGGEYGNERTFSPVPVEKEILFAGFPA